MKYTACISPMEIIYENVEAHSHVEAINAQRFALIPERVSAVTYPRPFSRGALILQAITPLRENKGLATRD